MMVHCTVGKYYSGFNSVGVWVNGCGLIITRYGTLQCERGCLGEWLWIRSGGSCTGKLPTQTPLEVGGGGLKTALKS